MTRTRLALLLALTAAALPACAGADDAAAEGSDQVEENLASGATRIAKGLGGPSNLQIVNGTLFYSTSHLVASGDPELDQQMAYWTGETWMKPLAGGAKKRLGEGGVMEAVSTGKSVVYIWEGAFNVQRVALPGGTSKNIFHVTDMSEDPYGPISAIAYGAGRAFIGQDDGTIISINTDGGDQKTFITTPRHGDYAEPISKIVVAGDQLVWATSQDTNTGSKYRLFRAPLAGTTHTATSLGDYTQSVSALATDGSSAYAAMRDRDGGYILRLPLAGSTETSKLISDIAPNNLVMDAAGLFYSVYGKGIYLVPKASLGATNAASKRVYADKNVSSFALSDKDLYVAISPGHPNEKKGEIHKYPRAKFTR